MRQGAARRHPKIKHILPNLYYLFGSNRILTILGYLTRIASNIKQCVEAELVTRCD